MREPWWRLVAWDARVMPGPWRRKLGEWGISLGERLEQKARTSNLSLFRLLEDMFEDGFVPVRKRAKSSPTAHFAAHFARNVPCEALEAVETLAPVSETLLNRLRLEAARKDADRGAQDRGSVKTTHGPKQNSFWVQLLASPMTSNMLGTCAYTSLRPKTLAGTRGLVLGSYTVCYCSYFLGSQETVPSSYR